MPSSLDSRGQDGEDISYVRIRDDYISGVIPRRSVVASYVIEESELITSNAPGMFTRDAIITRYCNAYL